MLILILLIQDYLAREHLTLYRDHKKNIAPIGKRFLKKKKKTVYRNNYQARFILEGNKDKC